MNQPNQPWFTQGLKISCKRKTTLYKKSIRNNAFFSSYRKYRNMYNKLIKLAKKNYYNRILHDVKGDLKKTWTILREIISKVKNKCTVPDLLNLIQPETFCLKLENPNSIAEYFNSFFASTGDRTSSTIPNNYNTDPLSYMEQINVNESMFVTPIDIKEVITVTLSIKSKSSTGHDDISNNLVKKIIANIARPLTHIFNQSFVTGIFPDTYKLAKVIPLFKSGNKHDPNNYRPISLLPSFSKILEKLMHKRLIKFITKHDLIYPEQYGFLRGRSTEHAMLDIIYRITEAIENKKLTLGIFLDLSKAFDTISHSILINKLTIYGIRGTSSKWFQSYLSNRFQYVHTGRATSSYQSVTAGVPQGSVLGPLLFLLYINDMPAISSILNYILFADDTTGLYSAPTLDDLFLSVNNELEKLDTWFSVNKLLINLKKTNFVLFMTRQKEQYIYITIQPFILSILMELLSINMKVPDF